MRVVYVHQYFSTREGGTGTRSFEFAQALLARGHQVTMICGSTARANTGLTGEFAGGKRQGPVEGIDVIEFDISYSNHDSIPKRAWKFLTFARRRPRYGRTALPLPDPTAMP